MALTGDLAQLHIMDIIQLIHTTRKSGTFSVKGSRGESRIIFSNGYIVGASHLNGRIRIGSVLVKMNAITSADLEQALNVQKKAGKDRKPLLSTLRHLGRLKDDAAFRGLKKLIEITIVELLDWKEGTFAFDAEAIAVSPECSYHPAEMEQEMSLDAQMVLMDALRVFDERERDRQSGKDVPSNEQYFADILPPEETSPAPAKKTAITADLLGLADLDQLESRIPAPVSAPETFNPEEIHRQKIREILADFPSADQELFVSFLKKATARGPVPEASRQPNHTRSLVLFSADELLTHAAMTICKNDGILVFATDQEAELDRIIDQCAVMKVMSALVLDVPGKSGCRLTDARIVSLRHHIRGAHPQVPMIQLASADDYVFTLQSFRDGVRTVLPKPARDKDRKTAVQDTIAFLETFRTYAKGFLFEQNVFAASNALRKLKDSMAAIRTAEQIPEISRVLLQSASQSFERTIVLAAGPAELTGVQSVGVYSDRNAGPAPAASLRIPLGRYSVFQDVMESGQLFFGECDDEVLREQLYDDIGQPLRPTVLLLPVKSRGQVTALLYCDFGRKEVSHVQIDSLEILAHHAGLVLENALYRSQILKMSGR